MARSKEKMETNLPAIVFGDGDAAGFHEGMDQGAYALPFLGILQGLSPQVQRGTPEYVDGALPGLIYNSVTKQLFEQVNVTVLRRTHTLCRWKKREDGGGFQGEQEADVGSMQAFAQLPVDEKGRRITEEGLELTEHRNFYVQLLDSGEPALVSMTKSQLKQAREWNTNIGLKSAKSGSGLPVLISEVWTLGTRIQKNKKGDQWYGWSIKHAGRHADEKVVAQVRASVEFARQQVIARQLEQLPAEDDDTL
jgi:hypothetical protein